MINLYYRCYVIHEDIPSLCYTIIGRRPHRSELSRSSSLMEAMHWVDRRAAKEAVAKCFERDSTRPKHLAAAPPSQL